MDKKVHADDCRTISVPEAARMLGISRNAGYEAVKNGDLPSIKIGRRVVVPKTAFEKLLAGEAA